MTERIAVVRATILICSSNLVTGCISSQDLAVTDPNEVAAAEQEVAAPDAAKRPGTALPSGADWDVYSSSRLEPDAYLGKAQYVCVSQTSPAQCPAGALNYGWGENYWTARIDACDGKSRWIWAPGITGASSPAELTEFYFVNRVSVPKRPSSAQVIVAADNQAEVIINDVAVGATGSITDVDLAWASQHKPATIDIGKALVTGMNTITLRAANGSGTFTDCTNCTYQQNPAGVVFCIDLRD